MNKNMRKVEAEIRKVKTEMRKVEAFHKKCLRTIYNIFWPITISNIDLYRSTISCKIRDEIKKHRFNYLGHVL